MARRSEDRCSFCGRSRNEVNLLISGENAFICDECAAQANKIVEEAFRSLETRQADNLNLDDLPKPKDIKKIPCLLLFR